MYRRKGPEITGLASVYFVPKSKTGRSKPPRLFKKKKTKPENLTALGWPVARRTISDSQKSLTIGRFKPAFRACARTRTNDPKYDRPSFSFHGHRVPATTQGGRWTVAYTTTNVPAFIN